MLEVSEGAYGCCKCFFEFSFCLNVCLMQRVLTCEPRGLRGLFERFGGI